MIVNKIYCENCLDTMAKMPDNFIDLTVTSPPYDNLRDYKGYEFDFESIAKELFRVTKDGGVVVWVVGDAVVDGSETGSSFKQALSFKECGFRLHDTMIYQKAGGSMPDKTRYTQSFEYMFVLSKEMPKTFNGLIDRKNRFPERWGKRGSFTKKDGTKSGVRPKQGRKEYGLRFNIWKYVQGGGYGQKDEIAYGHPATFPEQLASDHIYTWSNEGDLIYDPFMGSGTTAKAAHLLKRNWIGSEISSEYVDLANKRIQPYLDQTTMF